MSREIKFRAWSTEEEEMYEWEDLLSGYTLSWCYHNKYWALMQYTELKDRNKNEIYEGDILQLIDDAGNEIQVTCQFGKHLRKMDSGHLVEISGFAFISPGGLPTFPIVHNYSGKSDLDIMTVIGNIYENPELLNP